MSERAEDWYENVDFNTVEEEAVFLKLNKKSVMYGYDKGYAAHAAEGIEIMACGHPKVCEVISAESGLPLYCGWCNAVSAARDSMTDKMECGHERACRWPGLQQCTACASTATAIQPWKEALRWALGPGGATPIRNSGHGRLLECKACMALSDLPYDPFSIRHSKVCGYYQAITLLNQAESALLNQPGAEREQP